MDVLNGSETSRLCPYDMEEKTSRKSVENGVPLGCGLECVTACLARLAQNAAHSKCQGVGMSTADFASLSALDTA